MKTDGIVFRWENIFSFLFHPLMRKLFGVLEGVKFLRWPSIKLNIYEIFVRSKLLTQPATVLTFLPPYKSSSSNRRCNYYYITVPVYPSMNFGTGWFHIKILTMGWVQYQQRKLHWKESELLQVCLCSTNLWSSFWRFGLRFSYAHLKQNSSALLDIVNCEPAHHDGIAELTCVTWYPVGSQRLMTLQRTKIPLLITEL